MGAPVVLSGDAGLSQALVEVCLKITSRLGARGAAAVLISAQGEQTTLAASDAHAWNLTELEFSLGEGPSQAAFSRARPVLAPDMAQAARTMWPAYAPAALEAGVGAVFVFPMRIGAAAFGVLALYYDAATTLDHEQMNLGLSFAAYATDLLLESTANGATGFLGLDHQSAQEFRSEVYQAQGMVMVSLGVGLAEALARMRAHAFAHGQDLAALSAAIVAGTTRLPNDRS